ncbi:MAG: hypothetical protein HFJ84_05670 [Clostridiales bacterium]|jgi:16S rRNA A1518/A1519 N6-dimethyltransferase RsmA/KsgA/DIM1 with predicted DNA glycosylase/AP lyase activity|nr:hypothetical protein [Clostridiales bacterium]
MKLTQDNLVFHFTPAKPEERETILAMQVEMVDRVLRDSFPNAEQRLQVLEQLIAKVKEWEP